MSMVERVSLWRTSLNPVTATAALMIKDAEIAALKTELKNQRALFIEHAGRLNNRIKQLQQGRPEKDKADGTDVTPKKKFRRPYDRKQN